MKLKVIVGIMVLLILGFTVFGEHGLLNLVRTERQARSLSREAEELKAKNKELEIEVEKLTDDEGYIERRAREELGLVKPGELVIQFVEPEQRKKDRP